MFKFYAGWVQNSTTHSFVVMIEESERPQN